MIVPVVTAQVGCVTVAVGVAGGVGALLTVTVVPVVTQELSLTLLTDSV